MSESDFPLSPLKDETPRAFEAFRVYCESGSDRSKELTSQKLSKNKTTIGEWQTKYNWVERAKEYDAYIAKIDFEAMTLRRQESMRKYYCEFDRSFELQIRASNELLDVTIKKIADFREKEYKLLDLQQLTTSYKNVIQGQKMAYETWATLLGLQQLLEKKED